MKKNPHFASQVNTQKLAESILFAHQKAVTEEDLKMKVEPLIQKAFRKTGIDTEIVRYEKATIYGGRMDAVYGYLIIDYKAPGKLKAKKGISDTEKQLQRYLTQEADRYGKDKESFLEKLIAVAIDGESIIFVRYTRKDKLLVTPITIVIAGLKFTQNGRDIIYSPKLKKSSNYI